MLKTPRSINKNTSYPIPIKIHVDKEKIAFYEKNQYSVKQNLFDPTKNSPPNDFMIKLYSRMIHYDSHHKNIISLDNK
jgi:hypothetical protein